MLRPGLLLALTLVSCDSGGNRTAPLAPRPTDIRIAEERTSGAADELAAELLAATASVVATPFHDARSELGDAAQRATLRHLALGHLRAAALSAGNGPELIGSRRIARLALLPDAPADRNDNGSNLDEVLAAERARICLVAGTTPEPDAWQPLFPWRDASADLLRAPTTAPTGWRTAPAAERSVRLADIGGAMLARVRAAGFLLQRSRGSLAGRSADDGRFGLELLHQALATEETLLGSLFTNGQAPAALPEPERYDPEVDARWLPARVTVTPDARLPGAIAGYRLDDVSSDLLGLARLLQAASELAWLAGTTNPVPALRDLFAGQPFGTPGGPRPPGSLGAALPALSWRGEIGPLLTFRCQGCHLGFPTGGFLIDTLADVRAGSPNTRQAGFAMIVPGDHAQSFLWRMLDGPPAPFNTMPLGARLPQGEIDLVARWIDEGAAEEPTVITPPPPPGVVLARVLFANLVFLHLDPATGDLHHRVENGTGSGVHTARATGAALTALATAARALPTLSYDGRPVTEVLALIAARALTTLPTRGDLGDHAAVAAGLFAAADVLGSEAIHDAAMQAGERLLGAFWLPDRGWFAATAGGTAARYDARELATLVDALGHSVAHGDAIAREARQRLLAALQSRLTFAEWEGNGEVLGDGIADTDGDGIPEPAAAGGAFGRLPLFAGSWLLGDEAELPTDTTVTWSGHVLPLFVQKCGECHVGGAAQGNYRLDTVALAATAGQSGGVMPLLVPGDPEGSFLWRKLVDRVPSVGVQMPERRTPLDARGKELVRQWILQGASRR